MSISSIRKDYQLRSLSESEVQPDPISQFSQWWDEALRSEIDEVNAMTLSTVTSAGRPSARIVLLKGFDERGFVFYTNYESDKGHDLAANPFASLVFFWKELERQVRVMGKCEQVSSTESDEYFNSRPLGSKLGAWASPQSRVVVNREVLDKQAEELLERYADGNVPRPMHWGGYRVIPETVEFWQGRSNRLHDRIKYSGKDGAWMLERLAP